MPHPWDIFLPFNWVGSFQNNMYKSQLAFFILKLDKGTSYLHSKASLSFYGPFFVSHSDTHAISCLLNRLTFSLHSCLALMYKRSNSPPSAAWCQIPHPHSGSKVKFPTPRGREGVNCPLYALGAYKFVINFSMRHL